MQLLAIKGLGEDLWCIWWHKSSDVRLLVKFFFVCVCV